MIKKIFILVTFSLHSLLMLSMNVDSLANLVPQSTGKERIQLLNQIGEEYTKQHLIDQAINYFEQAKVLAESIEDVNGRLSSYKGLSRLYTFQQDMDQALEHVRKLESLAEKENNAEYLGLAYIYLSRITIIVQKDIPAARAYINLAISKLEQSKNSNAIIAAYNDLAISYNDEANYTEAVNQYKKALIVAETSNDYDNIRLLKSNIAGTYLSLKDYDKAEKYNEEALQVAIESKNPEMIIYDQLLLGIIQSKKGALDEALINVRKSADLALETNNFPYLQNAYEVQLNIYKDQPDYEKAVVVAEKLYALKDSLYQVERKKSIAEKETEIELLLENQNLLEEQRISDRQFFIRNGIAITALAGLILVLLLYNRKRLMVKIKQRELDHVTFLKEIEENEKNLLKQKLLFNEKALASKTMHIIQKNEILTELQQNITKITNPKSPQAQLSKINQLIENNIDFDGDWKKFRLHFDQVHPNFFKKLQKKHPALNNNETRLCAYIKMGLSTKEIAQLLAVNATSVQKARYRLKKKIGLDKSVDLIDFINKEM